LLRFISRSDVLLLLDIGGVYWSRKAGLIAGTIGEAIFMFGILLVRVSAFGVLGANGYQLAAALRWSVGDPRQALLRRTDAGASAPPVGRVRVQRCRAFSVATPVTISPVSLWRRICCGGLKSSPREAACDEKEPRYERGLFTGGLLNVSDSSTGLRWS
jgi:hypothetical protein